MFGLEKDKKDPKFVFELEAELADPKKRRELKERVEKRIQEIKVFLRQGDNKDEFDKFGQLLHGYTSLMKVITRFENPPK